MNEKSTQQLVQAYFRAKSNELKAAVELSICEHSGLKGSHREELQRIYLRELLPKRFSVGRGMIYNQYGMRSNEADIVIWDSHSFPNLPMRDHSFYFAESVRCVLESKSNWSTDEFHDVCEKTQTTRGVFATSYGSLDDKLSTIFNELYSIRNNHEYDGEFVIPHSIATAAIFLNGGSSVTDFVIDAADVDSKWPDTMLLLDPGVVFVKNYKNAVENGGPATIDVYRLGDDALLLFTSTFLSLLDERVSATEETFYLQKYGFPPMEIPEPDDRWEFRIHSWPAHRKVFWH